jgi:hypothetical protein
VVIDQSPPWRTPLSHEFCLGKRRTTSSIFYEIPLENQNEGDTITPVPPYDDFGDWATPKEPAAELFFYLSFSEQSNQVFSGRLFTGTSVCHQVAAIISKEVL